MESALPVSVELALVKSCGSGHHRGTIVRPGAGPCIAEVVVAGVRRYQSGFEQANLLHFGVILAQHGCTQPCVVRVWAFLECSMELAQPRVRETLDAVVKTG